MIYCIRSEWEKFFSYQWCVFATIGTIAIAPLIVFLSGAGNGQEATTSNLLAASLRQLFLSQAGLVVIAASFFGQEYVNAYLRTTVLAVPSRIKLIISKVLVLTIVVIGIGLLSSAMCLVVMLSHHNAILTWSLIIKFMTKVIIAMMSWLLLTHLTGALTIIAQSQLVPIAIMFSLILGLSQMLFAVTKLAKYLPDLATMGLFFSNNSSSLLSSGQGLLVQIIWTMSFFSIGVISMLYRAIR